MSVVTLAVYAADGTTFLGYLPDRRNLRWLDDLSDDGSASVDVPFDADPALWESHNIVKVQVDGADVFAWDLRESSIEVVAEEGERWRRLSGPGLLALTDDVAVYPEWGLQRDAPDERPFGFQIQVSNDVSPDLSTWVEPTQISQWSNDTDGYKDGEPEDWPDASAYWVWSRSLQADFSVQPGISYFRVEFTAGTYREVSLVYTADEFWKVWFNGRELRGNSENFYEWRNTYRHDLRLDVDDHVVAFEVETIQRAGSNSSAGLMWSIIDTDALDTWEAEFDDWVPETARGSATIPDGSSTVSVDHGMDGTPDSIALTANDDDRVWVSARDATSFTISRSGLSTGTLDVDWQAERQQDPRPTIADTDVLSRSGEFTSSTQYALDYPDPPPGMTPGGVVDRLVTEGRLRYSAASGVDSVANLLTTTFDRDLDSDGVAWPTPIDFTADCARDTLRDVVGRLAEGDAETRVNPDLTVDMAPELGSDLSDTVHIFDLRMLGADDAQKAPDATALLVRHGEGFTERTTDHHRGIVRERPLSLGGTDSEDSALREADHALEQVGRDVVQSTVQLSADGDGPQPYVDFDKGDWVTLDMAGNRSKKVRVRSIAASEDDALMWEVEVGTLRYDVPYEERVARWLRRMAGGTLGGRMWSAGPPRRPLRSLVPSADVSP